MQLRLSLASTLVLALVPCLSACGTNDDGEGDEEVGETAATEGTGESEDTAGESGEGQGSETGLGETAEETEGTTGDHSLDEQLCMDSCAAFAECLGELPDCYEDCLANFGSLDAECLGLQQALTSCTLDLSCPELLQFIDEEPEPYPCQAEAEAVCQEDPCTVDVAEGQHPNECYLEYSCPQEPLYSVACDANGCSCMIDGNQVATCDQSMEVCSDFADFSLIDECCGWDL